MTGEELSANRGVQMNCSSAMTLELRLLVT
jgi:hypothetical protein